MSSHGPVGLADDYEFVRTLGRGAGGWVVLARQLSLDRLVAVKTVLGPQLQPAAERLRREGRILAGLRCPSIVTVYQLLPAADRVSLVMEYLPGGDLQDALEAGSLGKRQLVDVLGQVARALTAAAAAGVVHRDVKPTNVLLDGVGRAVLADFGLARLTGGTGSFRTTSGVVTGTPLYIAPEQIAHPDLESPAADAYSFAVLAYLVVTGRHPFNASTVPEMYAAHLHAIPAAPVQLDPRLPRRVSTAVLRGLDKDPQRRPTPAELSDVLGLLLRSGRAPRASTANPTGPAQATGPDRDVDVRNAARTVGDGSPPSVEESGATVADTSADGDADLSPDRGWTDVRPRAVEPSPPEQWIEVPVYRVTRQRRHFRLAGAVLAGVAVGLLVFLLVSALLR